MWPPPKTREKARPCPDGAYCGMVSEVGYNTLTILMVSDHNSKNTKCACHTGEVLERYLDVVKTIKVSFTGNKK